MVDSKVVASLRLGFDQVATLHNFPCPIVDIIIGYARLHYFWLSPTRNAPELVGYDFCEGKWHRLWEKPFRPPHHDDGEIHSLPIVWIRDHVFICGGILSRGEGGFRILKSVWTTMPPSMMTNATNETTLFPCAPMPRAKGNTAVVADPKDKRIYVVGGDGSHFSEEEGRPYSDEQNLFLTTTCDSYSIVDNAWRKEGDLSNAYWLIDACFFEETLYAFGILLDERLHELCVVEAYNADTQRWTVLTTCPRDLYAQWGSESTRCPTVALPSLGGILILRPPHPLFYHVKRNKLVKCDWTWGTYHLLGCIADKEQGLILLTYPTNHGRWALSVWPKVTKLPLPILDDNVKEPDTSSSAVSPLLTTIGFSSLPLIAAPSST